MLIADLPAPERPRERLAALGAAALADRELLAILLGTGGSPGVGAHVLAERLLARFGSIAGLARAHPSDLASVTGIGPAKAAAVAATFELSRRAATAEHPPPVVVTRAADVAALARPLLQDRNRERLVVVSCDLSNRVLGCEVISEGAADRTLLPFREAMVAVLRRDGQTFALAHNHPSGDPTPSRDDIYSTVQLMRSADAVGLRLLCHVVVTDSSWRSVLPPDEYPVGVGTAPRRRRRPPTPPGRARWRPRRTRSGRSAADDGRG